MPAATTPNADIELRNGCTRWLSGHRPVVSMRDSLRALAEAPEAALPLDVYGQGEAMQALEAEVAVLLGVAQRDGFWLGARAAASTVLAGGAMMEVVIGDAADGWRDDEAVAALRQALQVAAA